MKTLLFIVSKKTRINLIILGGMILYIAFPLVASADVARRRPIETASFSAAANLQRLHARTDVTFAPPKFVFGHQGPYLFDARYGSISHRTTASIVVGRSGPVHNVGRYDRIEKLLQKECSQPFENSHYIVYSCRPK